MAIQIIALATVCFLIGLFVGDRGGYRYGYASGRVVGAKEIIRKFEGRHDSIVAGYTEARDEFIAMYDSLKAYKEELESLHTNTSKKNKDYAYCVGPNYFGGPALCQNCKRHIPFSTEVKETLTWTMPMYDKKTGTCPLHEPKSDDVCPISSK